MRLLCFCVDPQGVAEVGDGVLDLLARIGREGGKFAVGVAKIIVCSRPVLRLLCFCVDPQGVAEGGDGVFDLLARIGGEGGKFAVSNAEIIV